MKISRKGQRALSLVALLVVGIYFVHEGHQGSTINSMPTHYAGYILLACGALGCLGVNIWACGPFDPHKD